MGIADDFLKSFFEQYPKAKAGLLTKDELNRLMVEHQQKLNNTPQEDFDGISPNQMVGLLHEPFSATCILQFNPSMNQHLKQVPLFQLSELLLEEIRNAGKLKLTVKGNLPVRICELLFSQQLIRWKYMEYVTRIREEDIPYLWPLKQYLQDQGIVKKRDNALSLTQNGEKLMEENETYRFKKLFFFFVGRFHWGNFYNIQDDGRYGRLGWAFSLMLLGKYGDKAQESEFYSLKLMRAFEKDLYDNREAKGQEEIVRTYHLAYDVRFFECFADWFGLVNIERKKNLHVSFFDQLIVSKSDLFDHLFQLVNVT